MTPNPSINRTAPASRVMPVISNVRRYEHFSPPAQRESSKPIMVAALLLGA